MRKAISFLATLCSTAITLTVLTFGVAAFADTMGWRISNPVSLNFTSGMEGQVSVVSSEQQTEPRT